MKTPKRPQQDKTSYRMPTNSCGLSGLTHLAKPFFQQKPQASARIVSRVASAGTVPIYAAFLPNDTSSRTTRKP